MGDMLTTTPHKETTLQENQEDDSFKENAEETVKHISIEEASNETLNEKPEAHTQKCEYNPITHFKNFLNGFKRQKQNEEGADLEMQDTQLSKTIKARHLLMISLGTGIATGLLVGNGQVLSKAGPGGLVIGYFISSVMIYCMIQSAGELGICYRGLVGNFTRYSSLLIDPSLGFALSILYTFQWLTVLPLQLVTAAITIEFWTDLNPDIFVAIIFIVVIVVNLFGARGYAEAEFFCNLCKILMIIGFIILSIIIISGGAGNDGYIGAKYWKNPGAFANGFKGVCTVFTYAAFSYGGIEVLVLSIDEQENPIKVVPNCCKKVAYRILFIYLLTTILVCFLVPYTSPQLLGSLNKGENSGSHASPFVIAVESHGVKVVPHFINAVILISVISVANSSVYSSGRLLLSLSEQGTFPQFLNYIDQRGRPIRCFVISLTFGLIGFVASSEKRQDVFTWLLAISGLSQLFIWLAICLSHIRFRDAMKTQKKSMDEVGYKAQTGYWGSWVAVLIGLFSLVTQFWVAIAPVDKNGKLDVMSFFQNYLAFPIVLVAYFGHKLYYGNWCPLIPLSKIDLDSHRKIYSPEEITEIELQTSGETIFEKSGKEEGLNDNVTKEHDKKSVYSN
ncbi:amino acid transporter TAT1 NDAI_0A07500 [Naumovozyma dairenensis CBS 421]|uniref:Amino acid permease/ SLC12A domain-containing protein n=1 Tax=Naumovozyma dairenensis (strain ATCC 10597 / BCRC 20456 / CBS 421 / NBRC 0211 / NRRL Y-12639) TaxID=1071378 RepID=G0W516_NAUDC|nr:hypothetical protein NDAI_0A07500 [Naumovozyma dairenensis CBS 421]CCD22904.1 hypothetical protein NDAI_0A07500 [Naumovozyma dairenensis CBS 421]